jgi:hypothetical protein
MSVAQHRVPNAGLERRGYGTAADQLEVEPDGDGCHVGWVSGRPGQVTARVYPTPSRNDGSWVRRSLYLPVTPSEAVRRPSRGVPRGPGGRHGKGGSKLQALR